MPVRRKETASNEQLYCLTINPTENKNGCTHEATIHVSQQSSRHYTHINVGGPGPYLVGGQGGQLPPQRFEKVTITFLEVSSLPPQ